MKKIILGLILSIIGLSIYGQGMNIRATSGIPEYIYVGSLMKNKNSGQNQGKIKIELFGGDYGSNHIGSTIYRIGTRFGYTINKESYGGLDASSKHKLRVFENGANVDIVIETVGWAAFVIRSWILDLEPVAHEVKCERYDIAGKNEITNQFSTTIYFSSDASGNIGIGTLSPQAKLDVRGKVIADEVEIKINTGADFVFKPDYQLKPLSEIETFVKENQHLPDIPSEKEMQENGLNLNDMQIKLLQKIEELTLYVIEQDQKMTKQQKEISSLKQEIVNLKK